MYYLPYMKAPLVFLPCINVSEYYISNTNSTWSIDTATKTSYILVNNINIPDSIFLSPILSPKNNLKLCLTRA